MSTVTGGQGNIVTNGLVLNLDAANPRSYPQPYNGTAWRNLVPASSSLTGTLTNGPTFSSANGGILAFDGTNDFVLTNYNIALTNFTVCLWFKAPDSTNGSSTRLIDKNYVSGMWLGKIAGSSAINTWGGGILEAGPPYGIYLTLTDGQWHFLASTRSGTTHTLYGDGISNTTSNTVPATALSTDNMTISSGYGGGNYFKGNIAQTQIYNRALSASEVLQNFNATRARFGV
jgi:hypothetical protein